MNVYIFFSDSDYGYFVDGNDRATDGTFIDKNGNILTYFVWEFPPHVVPPTDDCISLYYDPPYKMNLFTCSQPIPFICEVVL